jgi:hypothetical protein
VGDVFEWHTEGVGGRAQAVRRGARPLQNVAGEAEQPAAPLGRDHLVGREAELVQIVDQAGSSARIGDSCGFQRIEIGHLHSFVPGQRDRWRS